MIGEVREHVLKLACLRHGVPIDEGRGLDRLPEDATRPLEAALVGSLDKDDLLRAFRAAIEPLIAEARFVDAGLAERLEPTLRELAR